MKKMTPNEFVKVYYPFAKQTEEKTGIDTRFTLAQAALETGWGASTPGNMFFGVKANPAKFPENKRQLLTTKEILSSDKVKFPQIISITPRADGNFLYVVKDWFRKYETPEESFTDHAKMLLINPNFSHALTHKADPYRFAEEIQKGKSLGKKNYATDPAYSEILKRVIQTVEKNM